MSEYERERRVYEGRGDDVERTRPIDRAGEHRRVEREGVRYDDPGDDLIRRRIIYDRISNVVWFLIGFIEALLGLRIILRLIAANPGNPFVDLVYDLSGFFVSPFLGIVNDPQSDGAVLEINSLIAMLVYLLLGYGILRLIWLIFDVTAPSETA